MKIAGYQCMTLSDYPGRVAAIVFTQGCNLRCRFCHNGSLLDCESNNELFAVGSVIDQLQRRSKMIDGLVITGGEPTLQQGLKDFIIKIRILGLKIKLDTNGTNPGIVSKLIEEGLIDYVAMDIKAPLHKYNDLTGVNCNIDNIRQSMNILSKSNISVEFRTTYVKSILDDSDIEVIKSYVPKHCKFTVQKYVQNNALEKETLPN